MLDWSFQTTNNSMDLMKRCQNQSRLFYSYAFAVLIFLDTKGQACMFQKNIALQWYISEDIENIREQ